MIIFVSYDALLGYPQPAQFGRGIGHANGTHTPASGMNSFPVDTVGDIANPTILIYGIDERFYTVTAPDLLEPKPQVDVDAIVVADDQVAADEILLNQSRANDRANVNATKGDNRGLAELNDTVDRLINIIEGLE